ncbi:MAG TPA: hypothetical protein VIL46_15995, partial [Gemmataceae bacterium]
MRWIGIAAGLVLAIGALRAADGADDSVPPAVREASLSYARHLQTFLAMVRSEYVREVSQARLLEAALSGLYEQARRPLPPTLGEELRKAEKEDRLFAAVYAARAALGNPETLAEDRDLMASLRALPAALDPHCGLVSAEELYAEQGGTDAGLGF